MFDLLATIILLLSIPYAIVGGLILVHAGRVRVRKEYSYRPSVSVFLPTYNEETNIAKKLDNLLQQTYPIKEILVVDCSTDNTAEIVQEYQRKFQSIKLINQKNRIGMARTLNHAFQIAKGDIFIKTDCDSISYKNALEELVANFADQKVGGATGICIAERGVEKYFRKFMTTIQIAETNIDSTLIAHATSLLAFRRMCLEPVKEDSLADDTEEFLLIRKKGYRTVIDPSVISQEEVPADYGVRKSQKDRRSQGIVRVLVENVTMLFNPKYARYGAVVLPLEWFILVLSPLLLIAFGVAIGWVMYNLHPLFPIALIGVVSLSLIQRSNLLFAIIDTELSGLFGLLRMLGKRSSNGLWSKVR